MKLINKQKVEEAAESCYPSLHQNWGHGSAFIKGVNFAEEELSNIAIDFSSWKDEVTHGEMFHNQITNEINYSVGEESYNLKELFDMFIENRLLINEIL